MQHEAHLSLCEVDILASDERPFAPIGWCIIRLSQGVGYCFADSQVMEIEPGELLIAPPAKPFVFRASKISGAKLHYFTFQPERLSPLLTLSEQRQFAALAESPGQKVCHLSASHEIAARFTAICDGLGRETAFSERCHTLLLAAMYFGLQLKTLPQPAVQSAPQFTAQSRFLDLVNRIPEADLVTYSQAELAQSCRCAVARFRRLFLAHFGVSFRSKQLEIRLERARQLLSESDILMDDVVAACGFKNRKLFNDTFKKHFGMLPAKLRDQSAQH